MQTIWTGSSAQSRPGNQSSAFLKETCWGEREVAELRSPQALGGGTHHLSYCPPEPSRPWRSLPTTHGLLEPPTESQGKGSHHLSPPVGPGVRIWAPQCSPNLVTLTTYYHHLSWGSSPGFVALGLKPLTQGGPAPLYRAWIPSEKRRRLAKGTRGQSRALLHASCVTLGKCINLSVFWGKK